MEPTSAHYVPAKQVHLISPLQETIRSRASFHFFASRPFVCTELEGALGIPMADVIPISGGFACLVISEKILWNKSKKLCISWQ